MKSILTGVVLIFILLQNGIAQNIEDPVSYFPWKNIVLKNQASFKTFGELKWGSGFLIQLENSIIACTARDFTGTTYTRGEMLMIEDFESELNYWKMYVSDKPHEYVVIDSLYEKERIEKSFSVFLLSKPYLTFSIKEINSHVIPLLPSLKKVKNGDTLYLAGYDDSHNLKLIQGIVETALNEKYADPDIRLKTNSFMYYSNFAGGPIIDKNGNVVGVINRAYQLHKNKKGKIINHDKNAEGSYFDYYVNGTSIRSVLGKDYLKKFEK
jgi:hypothetical protein